MTKLNWERITDPTGPRPRPRHGHRATTIKDLMIVFGGGNEGIVDELHVYNTATKQWFVPSMKGDIPPGCAVYGLVVVGTRLFTFGGMVEYGKYSNDLYELQASKWNWKKITHYSKKSRTVPCPRLGHSFTLINKQIYLFGGLSNESDSGDSKGILPLYLNDLHVLDIPQKYVNDDGREMNVRDYSWSAPLIDNRGPSPRESHTGVSFFDQRHHAWMLVIYGGMNGHRLGDVWFFNTETTAWIRPDISGSSPLPRSLHTATVINNKMFVFGGWVPSATTLSNSENMCHETLWRCSNTLVALDFNTLTWETISPESNDESVPKARAGHSAVVIHSKLIIWSGRDGIRKAWRNQVCCKDLWSIELAPPSIPGKVTLLRSSSSMLEVNWLPSPAASYYVLQIQKYITPLQSLVKNGKDNGSRKSTGSSGAASESNRIRKPLVTNVTHIQAQSPMYTIIKQQLDNSAVSKVTLQSNANKTLSVGGNVNYVIRGNVQIAPKATMETQRNIYNASSPSVINRIAIQGTQNGKVILLNPSTQNIAGKPDTSKAFTRQVGIGKKQSTVEMDAPQTKNTIDLEPNLNSAKVIVLKKSQHINSDSQGIVSNFGLRGGGRGNLNVSEQRNFGNGDGLSTLATAALGCTEPCVNKKKEVHVHNHDDKGDDIWYTVGVISGSSVEVSNYFYFDVEHFEWDTKHLPNFGLIAKTHLEAGSAYKFRVAALNSYGLSGWTQTSAFKTCVPGYPGAPSCIKVAKAQDGAYVSWDSPPTSANEELEYSVYLAVSVLKPELRANSTASPPLAFIRVHSGPANQCFVGNDSLSIAYIDTTNKPAIIFRIVAKNKKGFGPATQVRWLQIGL